MGCSFDFFSVTEDTSPLLKPYPNWESNDINSPDSIVNVLRVRIDACDRLWAVDSGVDDIFSKFESVQPKKLIAIDLNTNEVSKLIVNFEKNIFQCLKGINWMKPVFLYRSL